MSVLEKINLPPKFSLAGERDINIFDQGHSSSCSANAVSNQIILSNNKEDIYIYIYIYIYNLTPSRLYQYFNSRLIENTSSPICIVDEGVSLKTAYQALNIYKVIDERFYEYDETKVNEFPYPNINII